MIRCHPELWQLTNGREGANGVGIVDDHFVVGNPVMDSSSLLSHPTTFWSPQGREMKREFRGLGAILTVGSNESRLLNDDP
jgi:hypothetical protein